MKAFVCVIIGVVFLFLFGTIFSKLSTDALGMAIGLVFGVDAAYRVGFVAAITVVCMAFGIDPASVSIKLDSVLPGGRK